MTANTPKQKRSPKKHPGFTLLELLVVIAIIGLLAAYVAPRYLSQIGKSEQNVARAQIESFRRALNTYRLDIGRYPSNEEGLGALMKAPASTPKWNGPYLERELPADPWGRPYLYRYPTDNGDVAILSFGKDGQMGGGGDNADIGDR